MITSSSPATETARATASAISTIPSHFMLDPATYAHGASVGFGGIDFYAGGRGGPLGDVDADVVSAAFVFFHPDHVRREWEKAGTVMSRADAAAAFIACGHDWADANLSDDVDLARLAELLDRVASSALPAGAPAFAAWRTVAEPAADRPKALVLHRLNLLRELRMALHGAAVIAQGIPPHLALSIRSPLMVGLFGYEGPHPDADDPAAKEAWDAAEAATDVAMGVALSVLDEGEQAELVALLGALHPAPEG